MAQFDLKNATIKIYDGTTPTPNQLEIKIGEGSMNYVERRNIEYVLDRGLLDEVREGDQVPVDVNFDFTWVYLKASTGVTPTVEDAVKKRGEAAAWTSTDVDECRPYAVKIVVLLTPACGADQNEEIVLTDFRYEELDHNLSDGTVSVSGKCNITEATVSRGV